MQATRAHSESLADKLYVFHQTIMEDMFAMWLMKQYSLKTENMSTFFIIARSNQNNDSLH